MKTSILTKKQVKRIGPRRLSNGDYIIAEVRHDDECGNGHNSFAITAEIYGKHYYAGEPSITINGKRFYCCGGGCCHDEVKQAFPELAHLLRWHLSSTDQPMHYAANGLYWAGHCGWRDGKPASPPNLDHLKSTIIYGALPDDDKFDLQDCMYSDARGFTWNEENAKKLKAWLSSRLEALQEAFCKDVEAFGFTW